MLRTLFFDFGGCIDAPGIHTRTLFFDAFVHVELLRPEQRATFQEAYTLADQRMMKTGEAANMDLATFNGHNAKLIGEALGFRGTESAADHVTQLMRGYIAKSRQAIAPLKKDFELGIISNFTGNLEVIMKEFAIRDLFATVTESYYAKASKPDPAIFRQALAQRDPATCLYIGDNPVNDIAPAKALGMQTVLIHQPGKKKDCGADFYCEDLAAFASWIQKR
jgi:HAD superfamily hydrolase (TIGR01509 family)